MGGGTSTSSTHVANATDYTIWVVFSTDELRLIKMDVTNMTDIKASCGYKQKILDVGGELSSSIKMNMTFENNVRVTKQRINPRDYAKFYKEGGIYASVYLQICNCCEKNIKVLCENYPVPDNRSFIVDKKHGIKMQMFGENIWLDDKGIDHRPPGVYVYGR